VHGWRSANRWDQTIHRVTKRASGLLNGEDVLPSFAGQRRLISSWVKLVALRRFFCKNMMDNCSLTTATSLNSAGVTDTPGSATSILAYEVIDVRIREIMVTKQIDSL